MYISPAGPTLMNQIFFSSGDEYEVIDFDAVTSGRKDLDDFEEIQYQPPETEQQRMKTRSSSTTRDKKEVSKFSKRKSNRDIAASRLRDLATKRKKGKSSQHGN